MYSSRIYFTVYFLNFQVWIQRNGLWTTRTIFVLLSVAAVNTTPTHATGTPAKLILEWVKFCTVIFCGRHSEIIFFCGRRSEIILYVLLPYIIYVMESDHVSQSPAFLLQTAKERDKKYSAKLQQRFKKKNPSTLYHALLKSAKNIVNNHTSVSTWQLSWIKHSSLPGLNT